MVPKVARKILSLRFREKLLLAALGPLVPALLASVLGLLALIGTVRAHGEAYEASRRLEKVRVLDPEPAAGQLDVAMASLVRDFSMFRGVTVAERWAGLIDVTPDAVPVISAIDQLPGLYVATGFSGHGFGIGPGAGRLMAELVTGAAPVVDPAPFRFSRFIDGSRPVPMTGF